MWREDKPWSICFGEGNSLWKYGWWNCLGRLHLPGNQHPQNCMWCASYTCDTHSTSKPYPQWRLQLQATKPMIIFISSTSESEKWYNRDKWSYQVYQFQGSSLQGTPWNARGGALHSSQRSVDEVISTNLIMLLWSRIRFYPRIREQTVKYLEEKMLEGLVDCDPANVAFILDHLLIISKINISLFTQILFLNVMTISAYSSVLILILYLCLTKKSVPAYPFPSPYAIHAALF